MRITGIILIIGLALAGCRNETSRSGCQFIAEVVDKSGLDGCRLMFQLPDNQLLEPVEWATSQPELTVGEKYLIFYEEIPAASICMAGKTVRITCITSTE